MKVFYYPYVLHTAHRHTYQLVLVYDACSPGYERIQPPDQAATNSRVLAAPHFDLRARMAERGWGTAAPASGRLAAVACPPWPVGGDRWRVAGSFLLRSGSSTSGSAAFVRYSTRRARSTPHSASGSRVWADCALCISLNLLPMEIVESWNVVILYLSGGKS